MKLFYLSAVRFKGFFYKMYILKWNTCVISSDPPFIVWHVRWNFETFISPSLLKHLKCMSQFCRETTNETNQFSKCETWIFNAILHQTKLWRLLLWIRIEIMSAAPLNLSIDSILNKLLCRFVNFEEMKRKITKWFLKKDNEKL